MILYKIFMNAKSSPLEILAWCLPLQWRHNGRGGVPSHQPYHCLPNRLFSRRSKKTSKLPVTCPCAGNSSLIDEFPAQMASNAENVSTRWRHHAKLQLLSGAVMTHSFYFRGNLSRWWRVNSSFPGQMAHITQTIFSNSFLWLKVLCSDSNFTEVFSLKVRLTISQYWFG